MGSRLIALFSGEEPGREPSRKLPARLKQILNIGVNSFTSALLISLIFHILLLWLSAMTSFSLLGSSAFNFPTGPLPSPVSAENFRAFESALYELLQDEKNQEKVASVLDNLKGAGIPEMPGDFIFLDQNRSEKERIEFFKRLIEETIIQPEKNLERASETMTSYKMIDSFPPTLNLSSGEKIFLEKSAMEDRKVEVYTLNRQAGQLLEDMRKAGVLKEKPAVISKKTLMLRIGQEAVEIPAEYFYRSSPYEKIIAKGIKLFSIVKGFPDIKALEEEGGVFTSEVTGREEKEIIEPSEGINFKVIYYGELNLEEKTSEEKPISAGKKFLLPRRNWPELLDALMAYPEEEQFRRFETEYLQQYDPNDPDLAEFIREFVNSNINGVIFIDDPFVAAFDSLEELFYKKPVFERLLFYIKKVPDSFLVSEFLFCLASSLDFERRVIDYLNKAYPLARECLVRNYGLDYAFNSLAKALTIKTVYEDLRKYLAAAGFSSIDEVLDKYNQEELKIYRYLARKGGEVSDRALFALGSLFWKQGDKSEAVKTWKKISLAYKTQPFPVIRGKLYDPRFSIAEEGINVCLDREARHFTYYLNQRAIKFHKWSRRGTG